MLLVIKRPHADPCTQRSHVKNQLSGLSGAGKESSACGPGRSLTWETGTPALEAPPPASHEAPPQGVGSRCGPERLFPLPGVSHELHSELLGGGTGT